MPHLDLTKLVKQGPGQVRLPNGEWHEYANMHPWGLRQRKRFNTRWQRATDILNLKRDVTEAEEAEYLSVILECASMALPEVDRDYLKGLHDDTLYTIASDFLQRHGRENRRVMREAMSIPPTEEEIEEESLNGANSSLDLAPDTPVTAGAIG